MAQSWPWSSQIAVTKKKKKRNKEFKRQNMKLMHPYTYTRLEIIGFSMSKYFVDELGIYTSFVTS